MEAVFKVCGTNRLWATDARAVVGPPANRVQRAEVNQSLKNNELSTTATVFAFHAIFFVFELLHIPVNPLSPLSLIKPTCQPVNI